jgi:phosphoribosyl-ATP pyrophosphohydrolase
LPKRPHSFTDTVRQVEVDLARVRAEPALARRTARLLDAGVIKAAKKVAEEAIEVALDTVLGDKAAVVAEADAMHEHLLSQLRLAVAVFMGEDLRAALRLVEEKERAATEGEFARLQEGRPGPRRPACTSTLSAI